jgi:hypothetical protein
MDVTPNLSKLRQTQTVTTFPSQKPIEANSSADKDVADPPSSPPLAQENEDSDDEMEMEVSVPQGLGDDHPGPSTLQNPKPIHAAAYSQTEFIVQVKETPYAKGKNGQSAPLANIPSSLYNLTSSAKTKDSSSASIIYGTYNDQRPYTEKEGPSKDGVDKISPVSTPQSATLHLGGGSKRPTFQVGAQTHERKRVKFLSTDGDDVTMLEASSIPTPILRPSSYQPEISLTMTPLISDVDGAEGRSVQLEPSTMSAQVPPEELLSSNERPAPRPDHVSSSHVQIVQPANVEAVTPSVTARKRKLDNKKSSHHPKRREIKVIGFGEPSKVTRDSTEAFQENIKHSVERIREDRTPEFRKTPFTKPTQGLHIRPPPAEAGRRSSNVNIETLQAQDASSTDTDVEMDRSPNRFAQTPIQLYSPPLFSSPILGPKRTSKLGTPKLSAPNIIAPLITTPVVEEQAVDTIYEEDASRMDVEQQRETTPIDSPSDLDTFMLDVNAISSTRSESPRVKQTILEQSPTIPEESDITYSKKSVMFSPYREDTGPKKTASGRMVAVRPKSGSIASDSDNSTTSGAHLEDLVGKDAQARHTGSPSENGKAYRSQNSKVHKLKEAGEKLDVATPVHLSGSLHGRTHGHKSPQVKVYTDSGLSFTTNALSLGPAKSNETRLENVSNATPAQIQRSLTVFQKFQTAYPEYTGTVKHFTGLCKEMYKLDQEDKMVPKWQWDDYLIRRRIDYKEYVDQCEDEGEQSEPYHRFYKDSIRDTLFTKGILKNRAVLIAALGELQTQPPITTAAAATPVPEHTPQRGRQSLPSFSMLTQPKAPGASHHARQSLPPSQLPAASPGPKAPQQSRKTHSSSNIPAHSPAPAKPRRALPSAFQKIPSTLGDPIESSTLRSTPLSKPRGPIDAPPLRRQSDGPSRTNSTTTAPRESSLAPHLPRQTSHLARTSRTSSVSSVRSESRVSQLLASTPREGRKSGGDEFGDWYKAQVRMTGFTGDSRVSARPFRSTSRETGTGQDANKK